MSKEKREKNNIIISRVINVVVCIVFIILLLNLMTSRSDKLFELIGFRSYTVLSGSMEPEFYPGDMVIIQNKNKANIGLNDIVTYRDGSGVIITHRIIEKTSDGYITKGDNNNVQDDYIVSLNNIIGKVKFSIPKLGYLVNFLSKPIFIAFEMFLLAGVVLFFNRD